MRIGVISDTHITDKTSPLPQEILEAFKGVDMIIHTGDFVDSSVLDKLKNLCSNVVAVYGNMDPEKIKTTLPEKEIICISGKKIGITHGCGSPSGLIDLLTKFFKNDNVDVIIFGHSHSPVNEKRGNILFFNPGSPTDKMFAPYNSYGLLEINDGVSGKIIKLKN